MDAINSAALHFAESEVYSPRLSWAQPFSQELMQQAMWFASVNNGDFPNGLLELGLCGGGAGAHVDHEKRYAASRRWLPLVSQITAPTMYTNLVIGAQAATNGTTKIPSR